MDKDFLIEKVNNGVSVREIARISNKGYSTVRYWLSKFEIEIKENKGGRKKVIKKCISCNKELNLNFKRFCNNKCQQNWIFKNITLEKFENGLISESKSLRRILKETRKYECEKCGISDWMGEDLTLQIDHIDGNYKNNLPKNLRFLCPNCHTQTETWGIRNYGNGRRIN